MPCDRIGFGPGAEVSRGACQASSPMVQRSLAVEVDARRDDQVGARQLLEVLRGERFETA